LPHFLKSESIICGQEPDLLQLSQQPEPDRNALEYETANVLVALDAAIELHLHQSLLQGLAQFVPFMQVQGLELVQRLGSTLLMSQTLVQWGNIHIQQQLFDVAHRAFSEALKLNERSDNDPTISALAQDGLAQLSRLRGENKEGIPSAKLGRGDAFSAIQKIWLKAHLEEE